MDPVGITLRPYRANDLDAMHSLDVVCFDPPFRFSRSAMRRFAEAGKARVVIAKDADRLVGFIILNLERVKAERFGYIVTLDVSPAYRRRGIAGQLMHASEQQALSEGCAAVVLHVFTGNEAAIAFYLDRGFLQSRRELDFYGPGRDAWVLQKPLVRLNE